MLTNRSQQKTNCNLIVATAVITLLNYYQDVIVCILKLLAQNSAVRNKFILESTPTAHSYANAKCTYVTPRILVASTKSAQEFESGFPD